MDNIFKSLYDSIMKLGGMVFPYTKEVVEDSTRISMLYEQVFYKLIDLEDRWVWLVDLYIEESTNEVFAIVAEDGLLFKASIAVDPSGVSIGELVQVKEVFEPVGQNKMLIKRQADNSVRWFLIASSNVVNRNGAIDSSELFDNLIKDAYDRDKFPYLTFLHLGESFKMGMTDWLSREENLLLASGTFDESNLAYLMIRAYEDDPEYWGSSISFWPTEGHMEEVAKDIELPMYTNGYFEEISILPEQQACCLFTALKSKGKVNRMRPELIEGIKKLAGDDQVAEDLINQVDEINREIKDKNLVRRESEGETPEQSQELPGDFTESTEQVVEPVDETVTETPEEEVLVTENSESNVPTLEIDDEIVAEIVEHIVAHAKYTEAIAEVQKMSIELNKSIAEIKSDLSDLRGHVMKENKVLQEKLDQLGKEEEAKKEEWTRDLPRNRQSIAIHRARSSETDSSETSLEDIAKATAQSLQ